MPVKACTLEGKPGFQWGDNGKCYTYDPRSPKSKANARMKAEAQRVAAEHAGYKEEQ